MSLHQILQDYNSVGEYDIVIDALKVTGGTPAIGKVLTSDSLGNATWQPNASVASQAQFSILVDGSGDTPNSFPTIQSAVNYVSANSGGIGSLIYVLPFAGQYIELVTIPAHFNGSIIGVVSPNVIDSVHIVGGFVQLLDSSLYLQNLWIRDDGKDTPLQIGTDVGAPSFYAQNCNILAGTDGINAVVVGTSAVASFTSCQITASGSGASSITSSAVAGADASIITVDSCTCGSDGATIYLVTQASTCVLYVTSSSLTNSTGYTIDLGTDSVAGAFLYSNFSQFSSAGFENLNIDTPTVAQSTYDFYNTSTASTDIVTGIAGTIYYAFLTCEENSAFNGGITATAFTEL